jgi:hypothetical protein
MLRVSRLILAAALLFGTAHTALAVPPTPVLTIAVTPTFIAPGGVATVTATLNALDVNCGKGQLQYNINNTTWLSLDNNLDVVASQFSAAFDSNVIPVIPGDKVAFRAGYASSGLGCAFDGQAPGNSPTVQLDIVAAPNVCPNGQTTGVYLSIGNATGNGTPAPGTSGTWSFDVIALACGDVYGVTAQGGANGWAPLKSYYTATGTVDSSVKNKNTVYLWTIGDIAMGETRTLTITVGATLKNGAGECGKEKTLNGDWSAMFAEAPGGVRTKSAYTDYKSTITVTCP